MKKKTEIGLWVATSVLALGLIFLLIVSPLLLPEAGELYIVAKGEGFYSAWPACTTIEYLERLAINIEDLWLPYPAGNGYLPLNDKNSIVLREGDEVFVVDTAKIQAPRQDWMSLFLNFGVSSATHSGSKAYVQIHRRHEKELYWTFVEALEAGLELQVDIRGGSN